MNKLKGIYNKQTGEERFWSKVKISEENECWEWNSSLDKSGYGQIGIEGKTKKTHRVAWELYHNKKIPKDKQVNHSCDNPPCCNPKHLKLGTNQDNMDDKVANGRQSRLKGEQNGRTKLSWNKVKNIRRLSARKRRNGTRIFTYKELAEYYRVSGRQISFIVSNQEWFDPNYIPLEMEIKGGVKGEQVWSSKLTQRQVDEIREYWKTGDYTQQSLANFYKISRGHICKVINNEMWK